MKKIMSIIIVVALVLAQSNIAGAFTSRVKLTIPAYVDLSGKPGDEVYTLSVTVKELTDNSVSDPQQIGWSGVAAPGTTPGTEWKKADQYIEVTYNSNVVGWGVQIYTDNMNAQGLDPAPSPQYSGHPKIDPGQQPAGLIGMDNPLLTCPMVLLVTDDVIPNPGTNLEIPEETTDGTPGAPDYVVYFKNGYDEVAEDPGDPIAYEKVWFWLKDLSSSKWPEDTNGNGLADPDEIKSDFGDPVVYPAPGIVAGKDEYATIVNTFGSSSGWWTPASGIMVRDNASATPIYVYLAADFTNAKELQEYTTNTLTLELYHQ